MGKIVTKKWDMASIQMLSLARNLFVGQLPPESFESEKLESLDLSDHVHGCISSAEHGC